MNLMLQLPALAYAIAFHEELVQVIFGTKFVEHSWLLPLIAAFSTVNVIAIPATLVAQYEEKAGIILLSKVFAIYNVVALLVLLPIIGIFGAAIASGSAQVLKSAFIWWHVRDLARWTNAGRAVSSGLAVWGTVVTVCYLLKSAASAHQIISLVAGLAVVSIGLLVHVRGPAVSASDRAILANVLRGREARLLTLVGVLPRKNSDSGSST
jgi:O-antigen/teichoic acid export membrane protein